MKKTIGVFAAGVFSIFLLLVAGCKDDTSKGTGPIDPGPTGSVISHTGCKDFFTDPAYFDISEDKSCIDYEYDGQGKLTLKHVNAGFNCCPDMLDADVSLVGDTLVIEESESLASGGCDCLCLFDLDIEVKNLDPGRYFIKVVEVYVDEDDEKLFFEADLSLQTAGSYCVNRDHYPWAQCFNEQEDREKLRRMHDEIIAMIGIPHCDGVGECRFIGLGSKPCGGPHKYVIYSTSTVDEKVLLKKIEHFNVFEDVLNHRYSYMSDCMVPSPPVLGCVGGVCKDLNLE